MGLCKARAKQQREKSFHGGFASSGVSCSKNQEGELNTHSPMQVISNVAYIILEESDLGEIGHNFWKEVTTNFKTK